MQNWLRMAAVIPLVGLVGCLPNERFSLLPEQPGVTFSTRQDVTTPKLAAARTKPKCVT